MARVIRWTRLALSDLVAARDYIAADNPAVAEAFVGKVRAIVDRLVDFPESGRIVPERRAQGYREIIVAPYRVVYSIATGDVRVLRVWHGRRSMSE